MLPIAVAAAPLSVATADGPIGHAGAEKAAPAVCLLNRVRRSNALPQVAPKKHVDAKDFFGKAAAKPATATKEAPKPEPAQPAAKTAGHMHQRCSVH